MKVNNYENKIDVIKNNTSVRARLKAYTDMHPVSLSKIGCLIGLDVEHRYVLGRFARNEWDLNPDTLTALDNFAEQRFLTATHTDRAEPPCRYYFLFQMEQQLYY